jgi:hypothetical protein
MPLTSEQARAMNAQPKISVEDRDRLIHLLAEGKKPAELALQFGKAVGTIYNFATRWKAEIDDLRRSRTVQFDDIAGTRKQARLDDYWSLRTAFMMLFRKHLESCYATNPMTGEKEFIEQLVDAKKLKIYSDAVDKNNRLLMIETGQQVSLPEQYSQYALGLGSNAEGVDYAKISQRKRVAAAEKQRREDAERKWLIENAETVAEDEVDRLLSLARRLKQSPPSFQRMSNAAHEALGEIDDDEVHARVDRWLADRFLDGRVGAEVVNRDSNLAVTGPDVVDHGQVAAAVAAEASEKGRDVEVGRVNPPPIEVEDSESESEPKQVSEPNGDSEPVSEIPPVPFEVEQAARALANRVWSAGVQTRSLLCRGLNQHAADQYLTHAVHCGWVTIDGDRITRGETDPRPAEVTMIPEF